jgi:cytochrome c2
LPFSAAEQRRNELSRALAQGAKLKPKLAEGRAIGTPRRVWRVLFAILVVELAAFAAGAYFGRWAVKNQGKARFEAALHSVFDKEPAPSLETNEEWIGKNTLLARIETAEVHLPTADGWGGGIQPMDDSRIFYATVKGDFGVIGTDGITRALPFAVDMNLDALRRHPVFHLKSFNYSSWVRVTDINLTPIGGSRYELLIGHHYFNANGPCIDLRLSRGLLRATGRAISLEEPFRTVLTTKPCITFNHAGYENAFEGHFAGGRITRLDRDHVLFSTGDHGWVGVRGYPALAQDDDSTLGKILLVKVPTNEVAIFAKGVRNPQGLTVDSKGRIWETEHGPRGGDELNLIVKGQNYGWPESTYGTDYGPRPWPLNPQQGIHDFGRPPQFAWSPSIAPSNLLEVTGAEFPLWRGDLLVASLAGQTLHRLRLDGTRVVYDEPISFEGNRLRDIIELPSGELALLTDRPTVILLRNADAHSEAPFLDATHQQRRTADMSIEERARAVAGRYADGADSVVDVSSPLPAAAARGERVFNTNCSSCHSLDSTTSVVGPNLKRVIGRRVGSTDFAYSDALSRAHDVWTSRRIVDFAVSPSSEYVGTTMKAVSLRPADRRDLQSYLEIGAH